MKNPLISIRDDWRTRIFFACICAVISAGLISEFPYGKGFWGGIGIALMIVSILTIIFTIATTDL